MSLLHLRRGTPHPTADLGTGSAAEPLLRSVGRWHHAGLTKAGKVVDDATLMDDATVGAEGQEDHLFEFEASTGCRQRTPRPGLCSAAPEVHRHAIVLGDHAQQLL